MILQQHNNIKTEEITNMKTFEIGKTYTARSIGDRNCIFEIEVTGRTEKTIKYNYEGKERRSKIKINNDGEYVIPENYSFAPIFRAS